MDSDVKYVEKDTNGMRYYRCPVVDDYITYSLRDFTEHLYNKHGCALDPARFPIKVYRCRAVECMHVTASSDPVHPDIPCERCGRLNSYREISVSEIQLRAPDWRQATCCGNCEDFRSVQLYCGRYKHQTSPSRVCRTPTIPTSPDPIDKAIRASVDEWRTFTRWREEMLESHKSLTKRPEVLPLLTDAWKKVVRLKLTNDDVHEMERDLRELGIEDINVSKLTDSMIGALFRGEKK